MPFCSETCRTACVEHGLGETTAGVSTVSDFGYDVHCEQCGKPISGDDQREVIPGATREEVRQIQMQDIVGDYDTPNQIAEWSWVECNASYGHVRNGEAGIWEFVLNLSRQFKDVPERIKPILESAHRDHITYLLFHQGT